MSILTGQSNINMYTGTNLRNYSFFVGGTNTKHQVLHEFTPLKTGYARLFVLRLPEFLWHLFPRRSKNFRHILEYCTVGVDGIADLQLETEQVGGGYANRQMDVGTRTTDETNEITIKLYEFSGSPVREYLDLWMTGIADPQTGLAHYHGALQIAGKGLKNDENNSINTNIKYNQANHTMEMLYVNTDPTGLEDYVQNAALITNMMPKTSKRSHFNYESGQHEVVQLDVPFTAVKYESTQINELAKAFIKKYRILRNYLNFQSGYTLENGGDTIMFPGSATNTTNTGQVGAFQDVVLADVERYNNEGGTTTGRSDVRVAGATESDPSSHIPGQPVFG